MTEPTCVCGHSENEHGDDGQHCLAQGPDGMPICDCTGFRLALSWPDSEGWW